MDYAYLRQQISMEQVLEHLGLLSQLRGGGRQRRGPCPLHSHPPGAVPTFSVNLSKNMFSASTRSAGVQGNVLDLWGAVHRLPLYEAALHLAETFGLPRNREEEPVPASPWRGTRTPPGPLLQNLGVLHDTLPLGRLPEASLNTEFTYRCAYANGQTQSHHPRHLTVIPTKSA